MAKLTLHRLKMKRGKYRAKWLAVAGLAIAVAISASLPGIWSGVPSAAQRHPAARLDSASPATDGASATRRGACGRLAAALQRYASGGTRTRTAERSRIPPPAAAAATAPSAALAAFLEPAATAAIAHAESHGDLGAPDARAETAGATDFRAVAAASSGPPENGGQGNCRSLRAMPPEQREQVIDSPRFKGMFSNQEREMMRGATRLPLAPRKMERTNPSSCSKPVLVARSSVFGRSIQLIHQRQHPANRERHLANLFRIRGVRRHLQILIQILGREPVQSHAVAQKGTLLHVFGRSRIDHQNEVGDRQAPCGSCAWKDKRS